MRATYDYAEPGVDLHRSRQCREQPRLLRGDPGHQPVRRAAVAALWRLPARLDQSGAAGRAAVHGRCGAGRCGRLARARAHRRALPRQRHRRLELSAAGAAPGGQGQAPHRPRRHRARRRADHVRGAVWHARQAAKLAGTWMAAIERAAYLASAELAAEKGAFPLFDAEPVSRLAQRRAARRRRARGHRPPRHPQRLPDLDRADRHHLAARRQRVERHRAGVRFPYRAACSAPAATARGAGGGLRARAVPAHASAPTRAAAARVRHRGGPVAARASRACRRRCSGTSTAPSPRPSTAPRTFPSRPSRTCTSRPTSSGSRAAPPSAPTP